MQRAVSASADPFAWVRAPHILSARVHMRAVANIQERGNRRQNDFAAGRFCAAHALRDAGAGDTSVGISADRSPLWPEGFVGSITHSKALACAAVARAADVRAVGIDSELIMSDEVARDVIPLVLDERERRVVAEGGGGSRELETLGFSAKESLFKCLYPCARVFFEFADAELEWIRAANPTDKSIGAFGLRLRRPLGVVFPSGFCVEGRYAIDGGHVHTAVELLP